MFEYPLKADSVNQQFNEMNQRIPKFPFQMDQITIVAHAPICEEPLDLSTVYNYCCREFGIYEHVFERIQLDGIHINFVFRNAIIIGNQSQLMRILIFFEDKMMIFKKRLVYDYQL